MTCDDVAATAPAFERLVADRRRESAQASALRVDRLRHGDALRRAIIDAYQFARTADQLHLAYAKHVAALGCGARNAPSTDDLQRVISVDDRAGSAKRQVVALWTPIARKEHLPVYQWNQL